MSSPQAWTEVRVLAPLGWQELVADALLRGPCTTAAFGAPSLGTPPAPEGREWVRTFLPAREDAPSLREELRAAVAALAERAGDPELAGLAVEFHALPAEDYATSWRKSWKPFRLGRLCLLPPWDERAPRAGELRLTIQPGAAFGSGRHATTRTCLRVLLERVRGGERVLDAGSGSGVLSVAAVLLGARAAHGYDLDPNATPIARELAEDNGVADRCRFETRGVDALPDEEREVDVVLANIYSDVIQAHAADLRARLRAGGWFAFSGCPRHHADATRAAIVAAGLALEEERVRGRWHTFVGARPRG